ncbi:teneurin-m isoform X1 [Rhipicephalus sanguineus]|uniref:teneurin-m isoform X1 n=1 Tax=Rhipicephalus sanguineus TaxID=34632 RepID=UPI001895B930|nr:teneurin-m isoform X1 [Rhipicephalus sanguineus]
MDSLHRRPYASSESWPESPPEPAPAVPPRNAYAEPPSYSETTGPMVPPAASRVNPQLIIEAPPATSTSLAAALTQRLRPRSGWQWACLALAALAATLAAALAYVAAAGPAAKPCVLLDVAAESLSASAPPPPHRHNNNQQQPQQPQQKNQQQHNQQHNQQQPAAREPCRPPAQADAYAEVELGTRLTHHLEAHDAWNVRFEQPEAAFVRFNVTAPQGARLALLARRNEPPSLTARDVAEVVATAGGHRSAVLEEVDLIHFLEPGTWFLSLINDDPLPVSLALQPAVARDVPTSCPSQCHGHGSCRLGQCHCFPGYIGLDCADSVCPVLCSGHGRLVQGRCRCEPGWKGAECAVRDDLCELPDCSGHGRCVRGRCICEPGFGGENCERPDCPDPECGSRGACVQGRCWCKPGWRGANCSDADERLSRCLPDCSAHGVYDLEREACVCFDQWTGDDCSRAKCELDCGPRGRCEEGHCTCEAGWTGGRCELRECDTRCLQHGQCNNGTCVCIQGWMGQHCTLDGCPEGCHTHGQCVRDGERWRCACLAGWAGRDCSVPQETQCSDKADNDKDGLVDCADSECCYRPECSESLLCLSSPEPQDILLRKQPPAVTASFYQRMKFLIEEDSVQSYSHRDEYSESQFWSAFAKSRVSVIRGRVTGKEGNGIVGIRVSVATDPQFGFTLTRNDGWFDILVNGGGAVTLQFQRNPFHPIKRTVLVPWNTIVVMGHVEMAVLGGEPAEEGGRRLQQPACEAHSYQRMQPVLYQSARPSGGCSGSAVLAESRELQETLQVPGSGLQLVYRSGQVQGYLATLHLRLTPSIIPPELRLVHLRIVVEGILFERTFEADPDIEYTFAWNKRNVYKQKVYGLARVLVSLGYEYSSCDQPIWTTQSTTLPGHDMDVSELGGWNLDVHHRYNFQQGVLQKGDGSALYLAQAPRVMTLLAGTGEPRALLCGAAECSGGPARQQRLLAPSALAAGPDGSVYLADLNLVRRVTPEGQLYTVLRLRGAGDASCQLTLSPTDGHLYVSDPERHQVLRVHSLDKVDDPDSNFDVVVGSGERCLPRDNCGDGRPALEAKLAYPKGLAVAVDNSLYVADGSSIRVVDSRGIIDTLIGDPRGRRRWRPFPCAGALPVGEAKLRWPTELAINPLDNSLHFIDDHMVLRLTSDERLLVVAGQPVYCPQGEQDSNPLGALVSFAFGPTGELYVAEVDETDRQSVRALAPDGTLTLFAGCHQQREGCRAPGNATLAVESDLRSVAALAVTSDGVVHVADLGRRQVFSALPYLPEPDEQQEYQIAQPDSHELFVFNKYGQHVVTRSLLTGKAKYTFLYNVNTSFGKLSAVTDTSGNKVAFLRDSANSLHTIETARGHKCRVHVAQDKLLESFVDPDGLQTHFVYGPGGLLASRYDATGATFHYAYDEAGRLSQLVTPSGLVRRLSFSLAPSGAASVSVGDSLEVTTVRPGSVQCSRGGMAAETTTTRPYGGLLLSTPWKAAALLWDAGPHRVLEHLLPVQAGMFPMPLSKVLLWDGKPSDRRLEWRYELKLAKGAISAVERALLVNGSQYLTAEYDWVAAREIIYNGSRRPLLVVQYDSFARPVQWLPTGGSRVPLNAAYDRLGRPSGWQRGPLSQTLAYDRLGRLIEVRAADGSALRYAYEAGASQPSRVLLPSGRAFAFGYDEHGGLEHVRTPRDGARHAFLLLAFIGFYRLTYTAPGGSGAYVLHLDDRGLPLLRIFPGDRGRVLYRYNALAQPTEVVFGGGKVQRNYTAAGLVRAESWSEEDVQVRHEYFYDGPLLSQCVARFYSQFQLTTAHFQYRYDSRMRMRALGVRVGTLQFPETELAFSAGGRLIQLDAFRITRDGTAGNMTLSDGTAAFSRHLDTLGRLQQSTLRVGDKELFRMELQYDTRGRVAQTRTLMRLAGGVQLRTHNFSYDADGQLTEMLGKDHWRFSYDAGGNIVTMQYMGNKIEILHDAGDHVLRFGETPFVVDGRGFVVQRGEERFAYNTRGQLVRAQRPRRGRYEVRYFYDARSRLAMRKDHLGNLTQFFYADPARPTLVTHVYNNADGRGMTLLYDERGFLVQLRVNRDSFYVACDQAGSPTLVFDRHGDALKEVYRGPYGHIIYDSAPLLYVPVDFRGGILDPLTGLVHFGERIYDSLMGRWMTPQWDRALRLHDVRDLHLYQFNRNDPVNLHPERPAGDSDQELPDWVESQGLGLSGLGMSGWPPKDEQRPYSTDDDEDDETAVLPWRLPAVSGTACAARRRLRGFSQLSSVEPSALGRRRPQEGLMPRRLSRAVEPFGRGLSVSRVDGRAVVRSAERADPIRRDVFVSVFNNSHLVDLHPVLQGNDAFYFVKDSAWRFHEDVTQLQRLGAAVNTTVHQGDVSDVRIHTTHAVLNLRYGSPPDRERQRILWHAKKHALSQRWAHERQLLLADAHGAASWSDQDKEHILRAGSAPGYRADYFHPVDAYPELADDPSNLVFRKLS